MHPHLLCILLTVITIQYSSMWLWELFMGILSFCMSKKALDKGKSVKVMQYSLFANHHFSGPVQQLHK